MQSLETIKEEFLTEYDGCCLGATQETSDANKKDILDYWLNKMQTREEELWQKLEENKRTDDTQMSHDHTYDEALEYAQSLLDVKEK